MIVTVKESNSNKYLGLFTEAYEYLVDEGKITPVNGKTRLSDLSEYYGHMADFLEAQEWKFLMLPLDEEPFYIDLNSRTVNIPASFSKCASVQKDQLAETIIFVADRYFDYMDLANTQIYVQWTNPEGFNGATRVEMMDLETEPGKLRFAWPLNDEVTKVPGNVKFSVRFFNDNNGQQGNRKLVYSLNTIESQIVIKPALQPELTADSYVEKPVTDNLFKAAIVNSRYVGEGVIPPVQPHFGEPGSNITADEMDTVNKVKVAKLGDDDTVVFKVQAIAPDVGEMDYKWYYKAMDKDYFVDCAAHTETLVDNTEIQVPAFGTQNNNVLELLVPQPTVRVTGERYYEADGTRYDGAIPTEKKLYQKFSTYEVPAEGVVTGYYQAAAINKVQIPNTNKYLSNIYPTYSDECLLPGPNDIVFIDHLEDKAILKEKVNGETVTHEATLVTSIQDDIYDVDVEYEWRRSVTSKEATLNEKIDATKITAEPELLIQDAPGWYSVRAVSKLNRETKGKFSDVVCKVTNEPLPPVVNTQDPPAYYLHEKMEPTALVINYAAPSVSGLNSELVSETLDFVWQIRPGDSSEYTTILTSQYPGIHSIDKNKLEVIRNTNVPMAAYRCLVVNNLNGKLAIFDHSGDNPNDLIASLKDYLNSKKMTVKDIYGVYTYPEETVKTDTFVFTTMIKD